MQLGNFSVSLSVKDIKASKTFYETLGFSVFGGELDHNWLIMKNGNAAIGLFQGMFAKNILTFNPGWDENATPLENFTDIRDLQKELKSKGIEIKKPVDISSTGPGSLILMDPDGNPILLDQHL